MTTVIRGSDNFDTAAIAASKLTGALPAIDGSALTGVDPDISPNAWHIYRSVSVNYTTANTTLDFDGSVHTGSNLTEAGGKITVSVAGMYLISFMGSRYSSDNGTWDWSIAVNSGEIQSTRAYVTGSNGGSYDSTSFTVPVQLAAEDTVFIRGKGYVYGSTSDSMTFFTGVRLGA
tara:strand:+ start:26 stop:550 length:525 start_codon:yes stop_codon:yes gene_type:complete